MKKLLILLPLLFLFACQNFERNFQTHTDIQAGDAAKLVQKAKLTSAEQTIVVHASNKYSEFVEKWKEQNFLENYTEFDKDFLEIKSQYLMVKAIVRKHWLEYSPEDKATLANYEDFAGELEKLHNGLVKAHMLKEAGAVAFKYGLMAAKIAGKL